MMRILLSAYACEPGRGSEPGVGWGWVTELANMGHRLCVVTRSDNRVAVERDPLAHAENVAFLYYDLPPSLLRCRNLPLGKRLYYVLWQWGAIRHVRETFPTLPFDAVHHVTYVSLRYPSFMGSLGVPFCFGPVSGGETVPWRLRTSFPLLAQAGELLRDVSNCLVRLDPFLCMTFHSASKILLTPDSLSLVPKRWRYKCETMLGIGLADEHRVHRTSPRHEKSLHALYVGRLLDWKGVAIALRAVKQLRPHLDVRFTIVGDGPAKGRLLRLAKRLELGNAVEWRGWLPHPAVESSYADADIFLFPSLRDSGAIAVLEAMAHGLAVVCTDLGGPGKIVTRDCGVVLPTTDKTTEQLVCDMAHALLQLARNPAARSRLAEGAQRRVQDFRFRNLVESIYPPASAAFHDKQLDRQQPSEPCHDRMYA